MNGKVGGNDAVICHRIDINFACLSVSRSNYRLGNGVVEFLWEHGKRTKHSDDFVLAKKWNPRRIIQHPFTVLSEKDCSVRVLQRLT